jgi:folate-binding protein YgfZ
LHFAANELIRMDRLTPSIAALGLSGVRIDAEGIDFGDPAAESAAARDRTTVTPLLQLSWLRATGPEAELFLQGQLSNDIRELSVSRAQLSSYNTPKGRVLALFTLLRQVDGTILLETQSSVAAETLKRLRMFVLRSKLKLDDAGDEALALGLAGPAATALLAEAGLPAPAATLDAAAAGDVIVLRRAGVQPRFSIHGPAARLAGLWQRWSTTATPVGSAAWRLLDILAGVPTVHAQTREQFVPQMLNLDLSGGISFTKGCYPGQEIVARLHYLGTAKRRMVRARIEAGELPAPGAPIALIGGDGQAVGEVVDAAQDPGRGIVLLAVLQTAQEGSTALSLGPAAAPRALTAIETLI